VLREASDDRHGYRLRVLIVVLWHGGLRVAEALALGERDLDPGRGSLPVRNGKGGRRREIGMDAWGSEQLSPWPVARIDLPVGPLFCVVDGPTRGRPWSSANVRVVRRLAAQAGVRRRFAPQQLRHAHAVKLARESVPLNVIQRQLGHANLGATSIYLQGIDTAEIIATVHAQARTDDVRHRRTPALTTRPQTAGALQRSRWTLTAATASTTNASATRRRPSPPFRARTRPERAWAARFRDARS
jgi:site-specific recombinase XerD